MSKAHKPCHLCKKVAELRPYGPRGAGERTGSTMLDDYTRAQVNRAEMLRRLTEMRK